jgi:anti-anti-sigma factor
MEIRLSEKKQFSVLALSGRPDALTAPAFELEVRKLLDAGALSVVVDLTDCAFVSSAGLRGILALAKGLRAVSGEVRFAGLQPAVQEVFTISGFTSLFKLYPTVAEATA